VIMDKFLTCYDYGTGGIWRYVLAESAQEIVTKYPELEVIDLVPEWMDQDAINNLNELTTDLNDNSNEFLNAVVVERNKFQGI
jgi:hypothetical protein